MSYIIATTTSNRLCKTKRLVFTECAFDYSV